MDEQLAAVRVERPHLGERGDYHAAGRDAVGVEHLEADQVSHWCHPAQSPPGVEGPADPGRQVAAGGLVRRDENLARVGGRGAGDDAGHVRAVPDRIGQGRRWVIGHRATRREQAGEVTVQVRHRIIGKGSPGEVRVIFVDAGVDDRPHDAGSRRPVGTGRGVGLDGGRRAVDVGPHDVVGPDPVDGTAQWRCGRGAGRVLVSQLRDLVRREQTPHVIRGDRHGIRWLLRARREGAVENVPELVAKVGGGRTC